MFTIQSRPSVRLGLLTGALLAPAIVALFFLGERVAGLPFLPFDAFDALARLLPGAVVTFGIDTMVSVLTFLGFGANLDTVAKTAEHMMGIVMFSALLIALAGVVFAWLNRAQTRYERATLSASMWGVLWGWAFVALSAWINRSATAEPVLRGAWVLLLMGGWGMVLGNAYQALCRLASADKPTAEVTQIDRRQFLISLGGMTAFITLAGAGLAELLRFSEASEEGLSIGSADEIIRDGAGNLMPNHADPLTPAPGTRREYTPVANHYRIDISSLPPAIDGESYVLPLRGAVANPQELTLADIRALPSVEAFITMSCISNRVGGNLIGTTKWTGVPMQTLIELVQPQENAVAVKIVGADDFDEYLTLEQIRNDERIILAYAWDDAPLPVKNGFPLRVHIPDRYGMKQPKWITDMEFVTELGEGYWVRRGWSKEAIVRATSVIDTIASKDIFKRGGRYYVPMGGIAWSGAKGISKVEVRVNEGEWQTARLRSPLSERTWVIWRYDWEFAPGRQTVEVRCYDNEGKLQIMEDNAPRPDGATGTHNKSAVLREEDLAGL
jgi:DMSO/TMAO reductase YedYZ molybdopterin-dependent catalytic subunit